MVAVEPATRLVDRDAEGRERVVLRFNKDIDDHAPNLGRFRLERADGSALPADVDVVGNDAVLTLRAGHGLRAGDAIQLASCLYVRDAVKERTTLASFDDRLNTAARLEGVKVASGRKARL